MSTQFLLDSMSSAGARSLSLATNITISSIQLRGKKNTTLVSKNSNLFDGHAHIFNEATNALLNGE